jgi:hypothetical protein
LAPELRDLPEGQQSNLCEINGQPLCEWCKRQGRCTGQEFEREEAEVDMALPSMARTTGKVKIFTEDGWAAEVARVRADVAEDLVDLRTRVFDAESALAELVRLKDGPRDEAYERDKPLAWSRARVVLAQIPAAPAESVVGAPPDRPLDRVHKTPTCGHCSGPQRGYARAYGEHLCHPDDGMDCYHLVTVYHHPTPCGGCSAERAHQEGLKAVGALPEDEGTR